MKALTSSERREIISSIITCLKLVPEKNFNLLFEHLSNNEKITSKLLKSIGFSGQMLDSVILLINNNAMEQRSILVALESALAVRKFDKKNSDSVELSWTGPPHFSVRGRTTRGETEEMIENANKTILLVGYSITKKAGEAVRLLKLAQKRGVSVVIVFHSDKKNKNKNAIREIWARGRRPKFYTRDPKIEKGFYKIHAKMIVVDDDDALITSANFTLHGLTRNFEIGLRVKGPTAKNADTLVRDLIKKKYLREEKI